MRYSRILIAFILTASSLILFALPCSASDTGTQSLTVSHGEGEYASSNFVRYDVTAGRDMYSFANIPTSITVDDVTKDLQNFTILSYGTSSTVDWERGYIYTFSTTLQVINIDNHVPPLLTYGIATVNSSTGLIDNYIALGDCTYTYSTATNSATYLITCSVYVDENFNNGGIENYSSTYVALTFDCDFTFSTVTILNSKLRMTKAIGEESYYQASIDGINDIQSELENMPESEYNWIYQHIDTDSFNQSIDLIEGDIDDMLQQVKNEMTGFQDLLNSLTATPNPCVYIGDSWVIPFIDVNIQSLPEVSPYVAGGYYYPVNMLNAMNAGIMEWIDPALQFVRLAFLVTFFTLVVYKMTRIEWWF